MSIEAHAAGAKVNQMGLVLIVDQDVGRFEVQVQDTTLMGVGQCFGELDAAVHTCLAMEPSVIEYVGVLDQLHAHPWDVPTVDGMGAGGDDFGDAGMVKLGQCFGFPKEPVGRYVPEVSGIDEFHRQLTLGSGLVDDPNFTKSTAADFSNQFEFTNPGAGLERERGGSLVSRPRRDSGIVFGPGHTPDHTGA